MELISQRMAEKGSRFTLIFEREDREIEEAMREHVSTIYPSANGLNIVESFNAVKQNGNSRYA